jgi:hypothetical protein
MPAVNDVGKPCAGEPHARFDGRELETDPHDQAMAMEKNTRTGKPAGHCGSMPYRRSAGTAPAPDPPASRSRLG